MIMYGLLFDDKYYIFESESDRNEMALSILQEETYYQYMRHFNLNGENFEKWIADAFRCKLPEAWIKYRSLCATQVSQRIITYNAIKVN